MQQWLWLTNGVPRINPFAFSQQNLVGSQGAVKLTDEEKARFLLFDNLVSKGALQLNTLEGVDVILNQLAMIKARMDAEAKAGGKEEHYYDTYLYQGLLTSSPGDSPLYMRHLDAKNDYLIMHVQPLEEITEKERLYILAENKSTSNPLSITFATTAITEDLTYLEMEVPITQESLTGEGRTTTGADAKLEARVAAFLELVSSLSQNVAALRTLTNAPALPLFFEYDKTPAFATEVLEHNFLYDAPATASYTVKTLNADNTEKEVHKGSYRINKLYRWRFKAGVLYSHFRKDDYTETGDNQFTLDDPRYGIDGTFGIQTYFRKQDIRSSKVDWTRYYLYTGLSMRHIRENFYVGLGTEPINGLALGVNLHVGNREVLTGPEGVPTSIRQSWGVGVAGAVLIDAALFVKLFSFGSARSHLGL